MDDKATSTGRRRLWRLSVPSVTFLVGLLLGVVAGRFYPKPDTRPDARPVGASDTRLLGEWVTEDGRFVRFHPDGHYDAVSVTRAGDRVIGETPYSSRYRLSEPAAIELFDPLVGEWVRLRLVFEGNQLTLRGDDGTVQRLGRRQG